MVNIKLGTRVVTYIIYEGVLATIYYHFKKYNLVLRNIFANFYNQWSTVVVVVFVFFRYYGVYYLFSCRIHNFLYDRNENNSQEIANSLNKKTNK